MLLVALFCEIVNGPDPPALVSASVVLEETSSSAVVSPCTLTTLGFGEIKSTEILSSDARGKSWTIVILIASFLVLVSIVTYSWVCVESVADLNVLPAFPSLDDILICNAVRVRTNSSANLIR